MQTYRVQGVEVPAFFYGTAWKEARTAALVRLAREAGFVAFDTANQRWHYVEAAVGEGLAPWLTPATREGTFLQTKFTHAAGQDSRLPYDRAAPLAKQVAQSCQSSREHLGVERIDALLLHGPEGRHRLTPGDWEVWRAMERLVDEGQVRLLGVSNVTAAQVTEFIEGSRIRPAFVQNRCFARAGWDREVRAVCRGEGVLYQGFSLLTANGRELSRPAVARVVERTGRTPAEVVFRFALEVGMIVVTGTSSAEHMRLDLACESLALDPEEVRAIEHVGE